MRRRAQGFFRQQTPGAGQGDGGGVDAPAFNDAEFPTLGTGAVLQMALWRWLRLTTMQARSLFLRAWLQLKPLLLPQRIMSASAHAVSCRVL